MKKALLALVLVTISLSSHALEESFFFHGKKEIYKIDGFKTSVSELQEVISKQIFYTSANSPVSVRVEKLDKLKFGGNIELAPEVKEQGDFNIILRVTDAGLQNAVGVVEALSILKAIKSREVLNAPLELFELLYNAEEDHPISEGVLTKINKHALENPAQVSTNFMEASTFAKVKQKLSSVRTTALAKRIKTWATKIKALKKNMRAQETKRKAYLKSEGLDKKASYQFNEALAANDRAGAVELLNAYLPWESFSPFELKMYGIMVNAMENPVDAKNRVMMYRGIGDDRVYTNDNGDEFQLPPVIVKNQGTFNRRLRSLQTMQKKWISQNRTTSKTDFTEGNRISTMLHNHMREPKGSPFRSLTPDIRVARNFGPKKIIGFVFDPRVIIPNYMSTYKGELEFLVPFATFPDEYAGAIEKSEYASDNKGNEAKLFAKLTEKLKQSMSSAKAKKATANIKSNVVYSYSKNIKLSGQEFTKKARQLFAAYLIYSKGEMLDDTFFFNSVFNKK